MVTLSLRKVYAPLNLSPTYIQALRVSENSQTLDVTLRLSVFLSMEPQCFQCGAQMEEILSTHTHKGAFIEPIMLMHDSIYTRTIDTDT